MSTYEEALTHLGNGKMHYLMLLVCGFSLMSVVVEGLNMAFVLPAAKFDLHITTAEQGLINGIGFFGVIVSSHFWGFLSDTWGRQKVLRTASASAFLCSLLSSMSYTSLMLLITRFFVGYW